MKSRTPTLKSAVLALLLLAVAGCGSASAPPVDLPAPITGRIDVSSPDADGNVTITGSEGAVDGGSLVMAVNESVSASLQILDALVPSAYAGSFPAVCYEAGHACAVAESDGSFVIILQAAEGDAIAFYTIDAVTGDILSEATERLEVPTTSSETPSSEPAAGADCAGKGLTGAAVGLAVVPDDGTPIVLKQGSDTTTNQLVIGDAGATTVAIDGCYAHSIALTRDSSTSPTTIAVTSRDDRVLWIGTYGSGTVSGKGFTLSLGEPMDVAFPGTAAAVIVAVTTSGSVSLVQYDAATGVAQATVATGVSGLTRSRRIAMIQVSYSIGAPQQLGLMLADKGTAESAVLTFFNAGTMTLLSSIAALDLKLARANDAAFFTDVLSDSVMVALAGVPIGPNTGVVASYELWSDAYPVESGTTDLASVASLSLHAKLSASALGFEPTNIVATSKIVLKSTPRTALVATPTGALYLVELDESSVALPDNSLDMPVIAASHETTAIAFDENTESIFALDVTDSAAVDIDPLVTWSTPMP